MELTSCFICTLACINLAWVGTTGHIIPKLLALLILCSGLCNLCCGYSIYREGEATYVASWYISNNMVQESDKRKDDYDKKCVNGDKEYNIEVEGEETISTGGTFGI